MKPDTFDTLITEIEQGKTLKQAIKTAQTSWRALQLLVERDNDAASRYARARALSAAWWADKAVHEVQRAKTGEEATIARVRSDVYRWRAKVANPREYGDRVDVQAEVRHTVSGVIALPDEQPVPLPLMNASARLIQGGAETVDAQGVTVEDASRQGEEGGGEGGPDEGAGRA